MNDTEKPVPVISSPRASYARLKNLHQEGIVTRPKPHNGIRLRSESPVTPSFVPYTNRIPVERSTQRYMRTEDLVTEDLNTFVSETSPKTPDVEIRRLCAKSPPPQSPRVRTASPSVSVDANHPFLPSDSFSSPKFYAQPVEDIVDIVMPTHETDGNQFTLYDAPPCLKRNPVRPLGLERSPTNGSKPFTARPRPAVVERRQISVNSSPTSPFARSSSLPAHVVRRVNIERGSRGTDSKLVNLRKKAAFTFDRSLSEDSRTSEVRSVESQQKGPSHPANPVYSDLRTRNTTSLDDYMVYSYNQQSNYGSTVNGPRIRTRSPSPQIIPLQDRGLMDHVDGLNSPYLDGIRTVSARPKEAIQRRTAFANSAPQSPVTETRSSAFESRSGSTAVVRNGVGTTGLPPVPSRFSTIRMSRNEHSPATEKLTPMGPPKEEVSVHIDPETGTPVKVTSRSQSFTDLDQNVVVTKTDEIIEKEDGTEHCTKQRTVRKTIQNSPRTRRPVNRLERHSESVRSSRVLRSKLSEEASPESPKRQSKIIGDATPYRATSQTNLTGRTTLGQQPWSSEMNIRTSTSYKNTPGISNYSAHRENLMRREDQRRVIDDGTSRQYSSRCYDESKGTGTAEILEEMETITLQPIGRGVHDLEPVRSIARSYRANTPTGHRFSPVPMIPRPHSSAARIRSQTPTFKPGGLSPVKANSNVSISISPKHPGAASVSETAHSLPVSPPTQLHRTFAQAHTVLQQQQRVEHQEQVCEPHQFQMGYISGPSSPSSTPGRSRIFDDISTSAHCPRPLLPNSSQTVHPPSPSKGASRAYTPGPDTSDGYRTIATTNVQREIHSPGAHSPFIANDSRGTRYNSLYESRASENHFVSNAFPEQQWRAHTVPPNYAASTSGASGIGDSTDWEQGLMKLVRETYREWYMPDKKREDIHFLLRDREPGAFIIRNSVSCVNSFSLGVKSPPPGPLVSANPEYMKSGPVKHFMIQTIPMPDGRTEGVQLRGFEDQPIFPGLVQFVHHHCLHPGPLPCQLRLPVTSPNNQTRMGGTGYFGSLTKYGQTNSTTAGGSGTTLHMMYLGSVNVDRLENEAAVRRAITHILTQSAINVNKLTKRCEAVVVINPQDGIRIHDRAKRGLLEKHIKPNQIVFCGLDPESRLYTDPELRTRGMFHARTVGLVVRKKQFWMHGNLVYVLTEIDPTQPALNLVQYVNQVFLS